MKFTVVTIGKIKETFIREGVKDFSRRINRYSQLDLISIKEEKIVNGINEALLLQREGKRILDKIPRDGFWVALDRQGEQMSSQDHFDFINTQAKLGLKKIYYLIGGPLGFSSEVLQKADRVLSLSRLTLPHEMAGLFLLEQIYRYLNFMAGEKYHK